MRRPLLLSIALLLPFVSLQAADLFQNGDFSQGKAHWEAPGEVVLLDALGNVTTDESQAKGHALEIALRHNQWLFVVQKLAPNNVDTQHDISYDMQVMTDLALDTPNEALTGSFYVWVSRPFPLGDFGNHIHTPDWHGQPHPMVGDGVWHTMQLGFMQLNFKDYPLIIALPPGQGTVRLRNIVTTQ